MDLFKHAVALTVEAPKPEPKNPRELVAFISTALLGKKITAFGPKGKGLWGEHPEIQTYTIKSIKPHLTSDENGEYGNIDIHLTGYDARGIRRADGFLAADSQRPDFTIDGGHILTDKTFLKHLKDLLKNVNGIQYLKSIEYSDMGMQGRNHVNLDVYFKRFPKVVEEGIYSSKDAYESAIKKHFPNAISRLNGHKECHYENDKRIGEWDTELKKGYTGAHLHFAVDGKIQESTDSLREKVFSALNNAKENGHDFTDAKPEDVIDDIQRYDADLEKVVGSKLIPYVKEWQLKNRSVKESSAPHRSVTIDSVYQMLLSHRFSTWYNDTFKDHVQSEEGCKNAEGIMLDLNKLL